jgi:hypothetical protein
MPITRNPNKTVDTSYVHFGLKYNGRLKVSLNVARRYAKLICQKSRTIECINVTYVQIVMYERKKLQRNSISKWLTTQNVSRIINIAIRNISIVGIKSVN